jgi:hypothetical protein
MPLAFDTLSHGEIPIGFFNIESDMFLVNNYFIFVSDLCSAITDWTKGQDDQETSLDFYIIEKVEDIGDLMDAINGLRFTGFIGELYKLYPFPEHPEDFKQNPEGYKTRKEIEEIINKYGKLAKMIVKISKNKEIISIGEYKFNRVQFHEVIAYIWRGGMPQWKGGIQPDYVTDMMKAVMESKHWLFKTSDESVV